MLIAAALLSLSVLVGKAGSRFGMPALLLFLGVGMVAGVDGFGLQFDNTNAVQLIGMVSLSVILFAGGVDTKFKDIRPIWREGITLATLGVLLTTLITGCFIYFLLRAVSPHHHFGILEAMLMAAVMSSTDSASVFSILNSSRTGLKHNLKPTLEFESGSNDPMAYMLVVTILGAMSKGAVLSWHLIVLQLLMQIVIGAVAGFLLGKFAVWVINRIKIENDALYPILVLTFCIFIFSSTYFLQGNGYLAVYIGGLVIGNSKFVHKRSSMKFFEGLAWLFQLIMFLTLGLLVNPRELVPIIVPGLIISLLMIFFTRPLAVFLSLLPFRKMTLKDKTYVSWVGLRGAVPIIFAIMPLAQEVEGARIIFNIVFLCTLVSLLVQGTSLPLVASWLGLAEKAKKENKLKDFDIDISSDIKTVLAEVELEEKSFESGNRLMDIKLPENSLAVMVKREDKYFVPTGKTHLQSKDKLLIMTDDHISLEQVYQKLNIKQK